MGDIDENLLADFKKTAYINICKTPYEHGRNANDNLMEEAELWKEIVREQIALYKPEIILYGGTYNLLKNHQDFDIDHTYIDHTPSDSIAHIYKDSKGTIIFNAYHPSYPGGIRKDLLDYYVDEIADNIYLHYNGKK